MNKMWILSARLTFVIVTMSDNSTEHKLLWKLYVWLFQSPSTNVAKAIFKQLLHICIAWTNTIHDFKKMLLNNFFHGNKY